jgi:hypothetical protein
MKHGLIALVCAAALAAPSAFAATSPSWLAVWAAPPAPTAPTAPAARGFENQTIRQVLRVSADGRRVRIRLTNEYGADPLAIGAATIAHATEAGASTSTPIALTFGGQPSVVIPARGPIYSDPVDLPVTARAFKPPIFPRPAILPRQTSPPPRRRSAGFSCRKSRSRDHRRPRPSSRSATPSPTATARPRTLTAAGPTSWPTGSAARSPSRLRRSAAIACCRSAILGSAMRR